MEDLLVYLAKGLVDEPAMDERRGQRWASDLDVTVELAAHVGQHPRDVAADEPAVVVDRIQRRREHDPRGRLPIPGELEHRLGGVRVLIGGRPVCGHHLVQPTSVQRRGNAPHVLVEPGVELVVDDRPVERTVRLCDEAVERHVHQVDELSQDVSPFR